MSRRYSWVAGWWVLVAGGTLQAEPLTFQEALQALTAQNLDLKKADESSAIARDRADQAGFAYFPSLAAIGTQARGRYLDNPTGYRSVGLKTEFNLFRFGGDAAKAEAAEALAAASSLARRDAEAQAELKAANALIDLIALAKEREIAQRSLKARQENVAIAKRLYSQGLRPVQDADKVAIDAQNEEARLSEVEMRLFKAETDLRAMAGTAVTVRPEWPWREGFASGAIKPRAPAAVVRPDRQVLVERLRALEAGLADYRARYLPTLDLAVDYAYVQHLEPAMEGSRDWTGTLALTIPLFDRLAARTDYNEQAHQKAIAAFELEAKERELQTDAEEARAGFTKALASAQAREGTLAAARKLYEQSLKGFQSGVLSANDLSVDQARVHDTELNSARGWAEVHRYFVKLCRAEGLRLQVCSR